MLECSIKFNNCSANCMQNVQIKSAQQQQKLLEISKSMRKHVRNIEKNVRAVLIYLWAHEDAIINWCYSFVQHRFMFVCIVRFFVAVFVWISVWWIIFARQKHLVDWQNEWNGMKLFVFDVIIVLFITNKWNLPKNTKHEKFLFGLFGEHATRCIQTVTNTTCNSCNFQFRYGVDLQMFNFILFY